MPTKHDGPRGRSGMGTTVIAICVLMVAALFGTVARQSWTSTGSAAEIVDLEADGAAIMHSMTAVLSELVAAQSAAVRGQAVDQDAVRAALSKLADPTDEYGAAMQSSKRLADLNTQVEAAFKANPTGRAAYQTYSALVDLVLDLYRVIGDNSHLVHDPDLDSFYLMEAAIVRLPDAMVYAGRAADLVALAGGGGQLTGEDAVRAAVARFKVSDDAEQVSAGLTTAVDSTSRSELGTNILPRLDDFRGAADQFAPPTMLQELATPVDAATIANNASLVFASATKLAHLLLFELQALLTQRNADLAKQRRLTIVASAAAAVFGLAALWLLLVTAVRRRFRGEPSEPTTSGRGFGTVPREAGRESPSARGAALARAATGASAGRAVVPNPGPGVGSGTDLADAGARRGGHAQ